MNAVDSLGKELTIFPGAVPDFDGTDAGALAVVDDRPTLDGNGESEQFIFCREVNVAAVALRGGTCWRVGENGERHGGCGCERTVLKERFEEQGV